jgi:hypothetical protein
MAIPGEGWVLSWRRGVWTKDEAVSAMVRAEHGDLRTDPAVTAP